jgi:GAF domain-containing protein
MSENWNKKQLNKRLDSIFTDLGEPTEIPGLSIFNNIDGWTWEINTQGIITSCSPDIEPILGYNPETILNQQLSAISDFDLSSADLPTHQDVTSSPAMVDITFYHVKGNKKSTKVYIVPRFSSDNTLLGWHGEAIISNATTELRQQQENSHKTAEPDLDLQEILSSNEVAAPIPSEIVTKPDSLTEISPETQEALELIEEEEEEEEEKEEKTKRQGRYSITGQEPSEEIKEFLRSIDDNPDRIWEPEDLQMVEQVHSQLELALENANLFQQTQKALAETDEQAQRLRLLNEMSEKLAQAQTLAEIYAIAIETTNQIFEADRTSISLLTENENELEVHLVAGQVEDPFPGTKMPYRGSIHHAAITQNQIAIGSQVDYAEPGAIQSSMVGPISSSSQVIGTLSVGSTKPLHYRQQDQNFMAQLLTLLNSIIENRTLFNNIEEALTNTEEQARRLNLLNEMSGKFAQAQTLQEIYTIATDATQEIFEAERTYINLLTEDKRNLETISVAGKVKDPQPGAIHEIPEVFRARSIPYILDQTEGDNPSDPEANHTILAGPIIQGGEVIGNLNIGRGNNSIFDQQDLTFFGQILNLLTSTVENRTLFQQIQQRSLQLETSAEVSRIATTILDPAELLPEVVELIKNGFGLYYAGIFLIDQSGQLTGEPNKWAVLRAGSGEAGRLMIEMEHKLEIGGDSMIGKAIENSEARIALDVGEAASFFRNPYLPDTRSEIALPLVSRGQVLGALSIQSEREAAFTQEDITSLQTLADQLSNAIENARLFEQTEIRAAELAVLNEMARGYTQTLDVEELLRITHLYTNQLMDAENFYLALFDNETQVIEFKLFVEEGQKIPPPMQKIQLGEGLTDWIIKNKAPVLIPNNIEMHLKALGLELRGRLAQSWLGVPIMLENKVIGAIGLQSYSKPNVYGSHELDLLTAVSSQAAVAIDNAMRFQQTQARARFEQLLREITTRVHSSTNADSILRTAVREVSNALGKQAFIELGDPESKNKSGPGEPEEKSHSKLPSATEEQPEKGEW